MNKTPSKQEFKELIAALKLRAKPIATDRAAFVITALYLQRNEGIEPAITIKLRFRNFNLQNRWVEFTPFRRHHVVRRQLSDESADHLLSSLEATEAQPDDLLHGWCPAARLDPDSYKGGRRILPKSTWNDAVIKEVKRAGFDPERFDPIVLRWAWLDEHPNIRENEVRADILAQFIRDWSLIHQQEGLYQLLYKDSPVLRPSWAYPTSEPLLQPGTTESEKSAI